MQLTLTIHARPSSVLSDNSSNDRDAFQWDNIRNSTPEEGPAIFSILDAAGVLPVIYFFFLAPRDRMYLNKASICFLVSLP